MPSLTVTSWLIGSVVLNWRDVSGESGYRVERQTDAASDTWSTVAVVDANVPSYSPGFLAPGTAYRFRVTPLSGQGDGQPVEAAGTTRLPAVTGLAFTAKRSDLFAIRWDPSPYANGYRVQRSNNGSDFDTVATLPAGTTTYADPSVQPLREYYYRVVAVNDSAQGLAGEAVFAASPATAAQALPAGWGRLTSAPSAAAARPATPPPPAPSPSSPPGRTSPTRPTRFTTRTSASPATPRSPRAWPRRNTPTNGPRPGS